MSQEVIKLIFLMILGIPMALFAVDNYELKPRNTIIRKSTGMLLPPPMLKSLESNLISDRPVRISLRNSIDTSSTFSNVSKESLTLPSYIDLINRDSLDLSNGEYEAKLGELQNLIEQNRYNFDLSFQSLLSANQLPTPTEGMGTTLTGRMGIQATKILYDGNRHYYKNENVTLFERLSKFKKLSAKDQVTLYATELYLRLLELQGRKKHIERYGQLTDTLYTIAMKKFEKGVSDNPYNQINAEVDKLALEKLRLGLQHDLYSATVSFKQAAHIGSNDEITLAWPQIILPVDSVETLQKMAIEKNHQIEASDALFHLKQGDILSEQGKNNWLVGFTGFAGAGYSSTATNIATSTSQGINWIAALQATYPLNREKTDLALEKKMVEALREKNNLTLLQQNMMLRVNTLFVNIEREKEMLNLLSLQKELMERQLKIAKYRFEGGLDPYVSYAASMKKTIDVEEEILAAKIRQTRYSLEIRVLTGDLVQ